jgi:hypothetical protein
MLLKLLEEVIEVRTARPRSLPHGHTLRVHHDEAPAVRHHGQKARLSAARIENWDNVVSRSSDLIMDLDY